MQRDDPVADDNTQCDEIVSEKAFFFVCCIFIFTKYKAVGCQYNAIVSLMSPFGRVGAVGVVAASKIVRVGLL
jgi:hypothetical protein